MSAEKGKGMSVDSENSSRDGVAAASARTDARMSVRTDARWTAADIPHLEGKVFLVTGANVGLGYATALELAKKGAEVILGVRSVERGEGAKRRILERVPRAKLDVRHIDLSDLRQVERAARAIGEAYSALHALVNNAGVMAFNPRRESAQNFELQLAVNHLGHFALTAHLLPLLEAAPRARVVTVSSLAHYRGAIHFDDLQLVGCYAPWVAYSQSKLANLLFALEFQRRLTASGRSTVSLAAHPGLTVTNITRNTGVAITLLAKLFAQKPSRGALPQLRAATDPAVRPGEYYGPNAMRETRGYPVIAKIMPNAQDAESARRLWELSEKLTGVRYGL